jgi:two-component system, LuxR family, sensor kinase FixL
MIAGTGHAAPASAVTALMMTAAYTWMAHALRAQPQLDSLRSLAAPARVVALGTLVLCIGAGAWLGWGSPAPVSAFVSSVARDWIAELNGIMVLVPALLLHGQARPWRRRGDAAAIAEGFAQAASIALVLWAVFAVAVIYNVRFFSIVFLPLIWIVVRWGLAGSALALVAFQIGILIGAVTAHATAVLQLQLLTFALCATGLTLGAVVTQRKRVEARLEEKQAVLNQALQLASVGEMTAALAHELSQPVSALSRYLGACEVLSADEKNRGLLQETLRKANAEASRASDVVVRLRDFYRRGAVEIVTVEPTALIESATRIAQARAQRASTQMVIRSPHRLPRVAVDVLQVETALLNVLNNAIDALSEVPAPRIVVVSAGLSARGVAIIVADNGPGVDPQMAERLFEPFNTSKSTGMGMGLAISRSLLRASGGDIVLNEPDGEGASFTIMLPLVRPHLQERHG